MGCAHSVPTADDPEVVRIESSYKSEANAVSARSSCNEFHPLYALQEKLGKGSFAVVYSAQRVDDPGSEFAVKVMDLRSQESRKLSFDDPRMKLQTGLQQMAFKEVRMLRALDGHENICQIVEHFAHGGLAYIVLERCQRSLLQALQRAPELNESLLRTFIRGMFTGVAYVHAQSIIHRDIKPDNFMCSGPQDTVKLCDFGIACFVASPSKDDSATGENGTPPFMAPEMLKGKPYGGKVDVWSLGVVVYVLVFGCLPYMPEKWTEEHMKATIKTGSFEPMFEPIDDRPVSTVSTDMMRFVRRLLSRNVDMRPDSAKALKDAFFDSNRLSETSLKPVLRLARRSGAFENRPNKAPRPGDVDIRLSELNEAHHTQCPLTVQKSVSLSATKSLTVQKSISGVSTISSTSAPDRSIMGATAWSIMKGTQATSGTDASFAGDLII